MEPQVHAEVGLKSKDKLFLLVGDRNFVMSQLIKYSKEGDLEKCNTDFSFTEEEARQITAL